MPSEEMTEGMNPIRPIATKLISEFDFETGTYEEFCQSFLKAIEKLQTEEKAHPEEIDLKQLPGTICRHWNVLKKECELGFNEPDDCGKCYCYIPWVLENDGKCGAVTRRQRGHD